MHSKNVICISIQYMEQNNIFNEFRENAVRIKLNNAPKSIIHD